MSGRLSLVALIVANLVPLFGVLLWDWDVFLLLLLFWAENVIIGIFGIARLIVARVSDSGAEGLFLPIARPMIEEGLLRRDPRLRLARRGWRLADAIASEFL